MTIFRAKSVTPTKMQPILFGSTVDSSNIFYDGIIQQLVSQDREVHLVSSTGGVGERLFGKMAVIHTLEMQREISPIRDFISLLKWVKILIQVRPKLLVVGTPKASLLGVIAARFTRVHKIVYIVHGLRAENTKGIFSKILSIVEWITLFLADEVIAVSPSLRDAICTVHPRFRSKIKVLGYGSLNGVNLRRFVSKTALDRGEVRNQLNLSDSSFVVGFVGRVHQDKGGDFLIQLMENEKARNLGLHLLLIGNVEDENLNPKIENLISSGLATLTGWTNKPEDFFPALDLLLHPTQREGLGMVLLEAQACEVPVLTNKVTGTVDAVLAGVGGDFAITGSLDSWMDKIDEMVSNAEARHQMGKRGRAFVMERYDQEQVVKRFVEFLDE